MVKKPLEFRDDNHDIMNIKDLGEQDECDRSVIFCNKSESAEVTNIKRNENDLACIESFIKEGISISPQDIRGNHRLGIFKSEDKDYKRHLNVTFTSKRNQVKIMQHLFRLNNAEPKT